MIKPMLAHKYDPDRVIWDDYVYMQPKLDGVRCLFTKDGAFSRTGKQFMNVKHVEKMLGHFFKVLPWIVLDGELYNHNLRDDFEKIISLVRKQKPTDEDRSEAHRLIQYHVYDYTGIDYKSGEGVRYRDRMHHLNVSDMYCPSVQHVESKLVATPAMSKVIHQEFLDKGYEGSIMRLNSTYQQKRSYSLMKFKDFSDAEATIVGYDVGQGKRTGTLGKFVMQDDDGVEFGCPPGKGYTYKDLAEILSNIDKYLGKRATFTYFERTKAGSYRHPLFKTLRNYE